MVCIHRHVLLGLSVHEGLHGQFIWHAYKRKTRLDGMIILNWIVTEWVVKT